MQVDHETANTYRSTIPKFMEWARERLAKEVAKNEELVNTYGTADIACQGIKTKKSNVKRNK